MYAKIDIKVQRTGGQNFLKRLKWSWLSLSSLFIKRWNIRKVINILEGHAMFCPIFWIILVWIIKIVFSMLCWKCPRYIGLFVFILKEPRHVWKRLIIKFMIQKINLIDPYISNQKFQKDTFCYQKTRHQIKMESTIGTCSNKYFDLPT